MATKRCHEETIPEVAAKKPMEVYDLRDEPLPEVPEAIFRKGEYKNVPILTLARPLTVVVRGKLVMYKQPLDSCRLIAAKEKVSVELSDENVHSWFLKLGNLDEMDMVKLAFSPTELACQRPTHACGNGACFAKLTWAEFVNHDQSTVSPAAVCIKEADLPKQRDLWTGEFKLVVQRLTPTTKPGQYNWTCSLRGAALDKDAVGYDGYDEVVWNDGDDSASQGEPDASAYSRPSTSSSV